MPAPLCYYFCCYCFGRQAYGGGEYIISLRTATGYDATMPASFVDRISVHYQSPNLQNSQLVATLSPGETLTLASAAVSLSLGALNGVDGELTLLEVNFCDGNGQLTTVPPPTVAPTGPDSALPCAEHDVDGVAGPHLEISGRTGVNTAINGVYTYGFRYGGRGGYYHSTSGLMIYWLDQYSVWAVGDDLGSTVINAYDRNFDII